MSDPLRNLKTLRAKVDAHTSRVMDTHKSRFACRAGCDGCCQTERTVSDLEYAALELAVAALEPGVRARLSPTSKACSLLLDGKCVVYEERPLICRSHGVPLVMRDRLDVCPLNFKGVDIAELDVSDVMSVDNLTAILVASNALFCNEEDGQPKRRRKVGELLK